MVVYPYPILIWSIVFLHHKELFVKACIVAGFILFLIPAKPFYADYFVQNIGNSEYILEHGEDELEVAEWLRNNTSEDEKIANLGFHYITTLSRRLPHNRYVYVFPWLVLPFDESSEEILKNRPQTVVVDEQTIADFPVLKTWPFLNYVQSEYTKEAIIGRYTIYSYQK